MLITSVICTLNRAELLAVAIQTYFAMRWRDEAEHELLIVDNGSTDATRAAVERLQARFGDRLRYVHEPVNGLVYARNRAIAEARGEVVAFLDDDIDMDAEWGQAVADALARWPEVKCFGGKIVPIFPDGRPEWIHDEFLGMYGDLRQGDEEKPFRYPDTPFGGNMIIRREVFERLGGFNPALGRYANNLLSGEESEFFARVHEAGHACRYLPGAVIFHKIAKARTERGYILRRAYWHGISEELMARVANPRSPWRCARRAMRMALKSAWYGVGKTAWPPAMLRYWRSALFVEHCRTIKILGQAAGNLRALPERPEA